MVDKRNKNNDKYKMLFAIFIPVFVALLIVVQVFAYGTSSALKKSESLRLSTITDNYAQSIRLQTEIVTQNIRALANDPLFQSANTTQCNQIVSQYLAANTKLIFRGVERLNKDGIVDCSNVNGLIGMNLRKGGYPHIDAIFNDPAHKAVMSGRMAADATDRSKPYITVHVPIMKNNEFVGTVGAVLDIDSLGVKEFDSSQSLTRANFMVVDDSQAIVYGKTGVDGKTVDTTTRLSAEAKRFVVNSLNGTEYNDVVSLADGSLAMTKRIAFSTGKKWVLVVTMREADVLSNVDSSQIVVLFSKSNMVERMFAALTMSIVTTLVIYIIQRAIVRYA